MMELSFDNHECDNHVWNTMIFELLRCSTFDKLEDGILPQFTWTQNLLVGIYDLKFDKYWNDNIKSWNVRWKIWFNLDLNLINWNNDIVSDDHEYDILAYTILILINSDDVIMPQWSWIWNIIVFHNLSNLGPYNPKYQILSLISFKFVLLELRFCGLIWPWIENMIFELLRYPTFDKLEDGILPWLTLRLAGLYDCKFNILKW
jgi:hypothetical protein